MAFFFYHKKSWGSCWRNTSSIALSTVPLVSGFSWCFVARVTKLRSCIFHDRLLSLRRKQVFLKTRKNGRKSEREIWIFQIYQLCNLTEPRIRGTHMLRDIVLPSVISQFMIRLESSCSKFRLISKKLRYFLLMAGTFPFCLGTGLSCLPSGNAASNVFLLFHILHKALIRGFLMALFVSVNPVGLFDKRWHYYWRRTLAIFVS